MLGQALLQSFISSTGGQNQPIADTNIQPPQTEKPDYTPLYFLAGLAAIVAFFTLKK